MRLIDADALKAESFGVYDSNGELRFVVDVNEIEKQPTVNADPVVRCEECAYRRRCMLQHFVVSNAVDSTKIDWSEWYCADGVRDISKI